MFTASGVFHEARPTHWTFEAFVLRLVCNMYYFSFDMQTWLYYMDMTIPSKWTLPCGVVSYGGWVLAAVPDARDKGHSRDSQSPLCQRHVTDYECLIYTTRIGVPGVFCLTYAAEELYSTCNTSLDVRQPRD
jgi:hypothetical protein